ncbi:hypothetical protein ALQ02_102380, partial [Pseudomonas savastanoi pv. phaseolicola]
EQSAVIRALRRTSHDSEMREQSAVIQALRRSSHDSLDYRSLRSSVGMQVATLCVERGRGASRTACDAERRTIVKCAGSRL